MKRLWVLFLAPFFAGCASTGIFHNRLTELVREGKYSRAGALVEESRQKVYGSKDELLYYLDAGFIYHLSGDYQKSNNYFENAKRIADEHFTKSITAEASTLLVSDNMRPYYGEDFERALIHTFLAINYFSMGDEISALVEARQVDHFLNTLQTNYGYKATYSEDAFARYLMGIIYESAGETNDAYISYAKAIEAYDYYLKNYGTPVPAGLVSGAYRTASKLGFWDHTAALRKKFPSEYFENARDDEGEAVVILYNGISPVKIDSFFEISFGRAWLYVGKVEPREEEAKDFENARRIARSIAADEQVVMAFPKYVDIPYEVVDAVCEIFDSSGALKGVSGRFELVEDIGAIAKKSLEERIDRIRVRTIIRATIKYVLSKQVSGDIERKSGDRALGWFVSKLLTSIATATELADKRSWRTLPDKIYLGRMRLPEGRYDLKIVFYDRLGYKVTAAVLKDVVVHRGKSTLRVFRMAM